MAQEVKRQIGVSAMTSGPFAQLSQLFFRLRSGALLQPRYLIGGLIALGGVLLSGCAGIAGLILSQL